MILKFLLAFLFCCFITFGSTDRCDRCQNFDEFDSCSQPEQLILPYGDCGTNISSIDVATSQPKVIFNNSQPSSNYILLMVDPDAPSRQNPTKKFWRHWLVLNLTGDVLLHGDIGTHGNHLTSYGGPKPPQGSGPHRYQFLLFRQPAEFNSSRLLVDEIYTGNVRNNFNVTNFVLENDLCDRLEAAFEYKASR